MLLVHSGTGSGLSQWPYLVRAATICFSLEAVYASCMKVWQRPGTGSCCIRSSTEWREWFCKNL